MAVIVERRAAANPIVYSNGGKLGCCVLKDVSKKYILEYVTKDGIPFETCEGRDKDIDPLSHGCTLVGYGEEEDS